MKIKLDECLDTRLSEILEKAGHEAVTVVQQGLRGIRDEELYRHCTEEGSVLVSLDVHFANVLRYVPEPTPGIVVLRGRDDLLPTIQTLIETLVDGLRKEEPVGKLWIVEPGRIRIHEGSE